MGGVGVGVGNASASTAYSVYVAICSAVRHRLGASSLQDVGIAVQGLGNVGSRLIELLSAKGAKLVVTDVDADKLQGLPAEIKKVSTEEIYDQPAEVFAPCALGAVINEHTLSRLKATVIAGGANNQLASPEIGEQLRHRQILYAPDYICNGGGIIELHYQINGGTREALREHLDSIDETLSAIFDRAEQESLPTELVADRMTEALFKN